MTGAVITNLTGPGADVEGLSEGEPGFLYGLAAGGDLYRYDIANDAWDLVGNTGVAFDNVGLAYDPERGVLFAKGSQDPNLYQIDPEDADTDSLGDTGIAAGGGLAFVADPTAGVVTATVSANGTLTLTGDAAANGVPITLNEIGVGTTVTGLGNTQIRFNNIVQASHVFAPPVRQIATNLKEGGDQVRIDGAADFLLERGAAFNLGSGNNTLELVTTGTLAVGGSLTVTATNGFDTVHVRGGLGSAVTGNAGLNLGGGGSDVTFDSLAVNGRGGVAVTAGEGADILHLLGASVNAGPVTLNSGVGFTDLHLEPNLAGDVTTVARTVRAVGTSETIHLLRRGDGRRAGRPGRGRARRDLHRRLRPDDGHRERDHVRVRHGRLPGRRGPDGRGQRERDRDGVCDRGPRRLRPDRDRVGDRPGERRRDLRHLRGRGPDGPERGRPGRGVRPPPPGRRHPDHDRGGPRVRLPGTPPSTCLGRPAA